MLTAYNGTAITYDAIGNPLKWRNAVGLTWGARELQRADLATNSFVNYVYNSDGIRTSRSYVNSNAKYREDRNYILDGNKIIQENIKIATISTTTNVTLYYLYDESGSVQGFIYNNQHYYFQKNLQGDVVRILNNYGEVVTEYTYDAWGKVLTTTGSLASTVGAYNPFRYRSYYYDSETGFYYLNSRYYDPTVGRFLNADGIIGANGGIVENNMYAYCSNDPISNNSASKILKSSYCKIASSYAASNSHLRQDFLFIVVAKASEISVYYNVPLYYQNGYSLCWAFCQVMVEDYYQGVVRNDDEATARAIDLAMSVFGPENWDRGASPTNKGPEVTPQSIVDLYKILVANGPVYAFYSNDNDGHVVVVCGVDLTNGYVYTNNPWDVYGVQTFDEFIEGFANMSIADDMNLQSIRTVRWE